MLPPQQQMVCLPPVFIHITDWLVIIYGLANISPNSQSEQISRGVPKRELTPMLLLLPVPGRLG